MYLNNSEPNQFYQSPQAQTPNNNVGYQQPQQIIPNNNQYDLAQQPLIIPFEGNQLEIPFKKNYIFISYMIISSILIYIPVMLSFKTIFVPFVLLIEILLFLYYGNNKIVIIKSCK